MLGFVNRSGCDPDDNVGKEWVYIKARRILVKISLRWLDTRVVSNSSVSRETNPLEEARGVARVCVQKAEKTER